MSYQIFGDDLQYVEIMLKTGELVQAEPGAMVYKDAGVEMETMLGVNDNQGFFTKMIGAGKRALTGESFFVTGFTNQAPIPQRVAFSAPYPGKIIALPLYELSGEIVCQKNSFLCAESDLEIDVYFQKKIMTGLFGGAGFIMQRLRGDGVVFVHGGGMIQEFVLQAGQQIQVDAGCLVGFQPSVRFEISGAGGLKTQILGGEGLFLASLRGPGKIWVQSLPFSRLAARLMATPAMRNRLRAKNGA